MGCSASGWLPCRYQGFTFLGILNTWIPLPVRWFSSWAARWWGQASSMLGVSAYPVNLPCQPTEGRLLLPCLQDSGVRNT